MTQTAGAQVTADNAPTIPQDAEILSSLPGEITRDTGPQLALRLVDEKNMLQKDVAELLHVSPPTVSRWVREEREKQEAAGGTRITPENATLVAVRLVLIACMILATAAFWVIAIKMR